MKVIKGGITAPKGFKAAGMACGIKKSGKKDLALVVSDVPAAAAGLFTTNRVKAAPVIISQKNVRGGVARAIIANSGCANACTGRAGMRNAEAMTKLAAEALDVAAKHVLVASTGSIGSKLPMDRIEKGISAASRKVSARGGSDAARAILTTDLVKKEISVEISIDGKAVRIGGIAKGSGMIAPHMTPSGLPHATMFCFITTDAKVNSAFLEKLLFDAVDPSFNMITVDNERSTNDCVLALANGRSNAPEIKAGSEGHRRLLGALKFVCLNLAKMIARDGEGATKLIEVRVFGAKSVPDARLAARTIAGSPLLKSAVFGEDPNWGRVMAALGYSGISFDQEEVDVFIGDTMVVKHGVAVEFDRGRARKHMRGREVVYTVNVNLGRGNAVAWGCDLTYGYVKINAEYHT